MSEEDKPHRRLLNPRLQRLVINHKDLAEMVEQESTWAENMCVRKGLLIIATHDAVIKTIEALHRYASYVLGPLRQLDTNQAFDGYDLAIIYVRAVIREQYAGVFAPSLEHAQLLDHIQSDPLHSTIAESYSLRNVRGHDTTITLVRLTGLLDYLMEQRGLAHPVEAVMGRWLEHDRTIHQYVATWLSGGRIRDGVRRLLGQDDEWLLQKLKETADAGSQSNRDYFNMWTASTENNAIPPEVLQNSLCPEIPYKEKP